MANHKGLWWLHLQRALGNKHGELRIKLNKDHETYQCARMFRAGVCGPSDKGGLLMISHDTTSENCGIQLTNVAIHLGNISSMLELP